MNGLNDKTIVLAGPFGLLMQNLISRLSEHGANIAVVTDDVKSASRVCQNIMDMREVSEKFGRAAAIEAKITDNKSAENSFSLSAETFGGIDVLIDTHLFGLNIPFFAEANGPSADNINNVYHKAFNLTQLMTTTAAAFLKARTRGRILYLLHELDIFAAEKCGSKVFSTLANFIHDIGLNLAEQNTSINALAIGVNEEYLLSRFSKAQTIQKSLLQLQQTIPHARLVDYSEIANVTSFMASPMSSSISGQILRCNHGYRSSFLTI